MESNNSTFKMHKTINKTDLDESRSVSPASSSSSCMEESITSSVLNYVSNCSSPNNNNNTNLVDQHHEDSQLKMINDESIKSRKNSKKSSKPKKHLDLDENIEIAKSPSKFSEFSNQSPNSPELVYNSKSQPTSPIISHHNHHIQPKSEITSHSATSLFTPKNNSSILNIESIINKSEKLLSV